MTRENPWPQRRFRLGALAIAAAALEASRPAPAQEPAPAPTSMPAPGPPFSILFVLAGFAGSLFHGRRAAALLLGRAGREASSPFPKPPRRSGRHLIVASVLGLAWAPSAHAQQTIFNVPSADVLDPERDEPQAAPAPTPTPDPAPSAPATLYGWVWGGFTANFDSPDDGINFGTNFNWRSNTVRLDQVYFVFENPLEQVKKFNLGYRVDFYAGNQAPFLVANGLFSDFTGFDPTSGYGVEGQPSFRYLNRVGIDLPQFYVNVHIPSFLTEKGIDLLAGKFWTLMGHEVYPAPQTEFYSHSYEIIYGTPFTHTGFLSTLHAGDSWDILAGIVVGSDVFKDNNDRPSYTGAFVWNSSDKSLNWMTSWITGPEQFENNDNYRTVVTSYLNWKFGSESRWNLISGGVYAAEENAGVDSTTGTVKDAQWYGLSDYLFYTVGPRLTLGMRAEWFRDDDGVRTAVTKRPGFAGNFYEVTLGATYRPLEHLRVRPEIRYDWFAGRAGNGSAARPYNDLLDDSQTTFAIDVIWEW